MARACYLAGFVGTSNVLAGKIYGLPIFGHHGPLLRQHLSREIEAFRVFSRLFPKATTLLIDTYDNLAGARNGLQVAKEMEARGERLQSVRLDSGDLAASSREVRRLLDDGGAPEVRILASGGFDEYKIAQALAAGALIDSFAVGTKMGVSADAPYFDIAYKLVKYAGRPVMKLSTGKVTLVDKKQVFRHYDDQNKMRRDVIALRQEEVTGAAPLLRPGDGPRPDHSASAVPERQPEIFSGQFASLPESYKALQDPPLYPVEPSPGLRDCSQGGRQLRQGESGEN